MLKIKKLVQNEESSFDCAGRHKILEPMGGLPAP
jgi:hypothetical protein